MERPEPTARFPLVRITVGNALLLSALYLSIGVVVDLARRFLQQPRAAFLAQRLDDLPGTLLSACGLLGPLQDLYWRGEIGEWAIRLIFAGTTLVVIFALAVAVGLFMALVRWLFVRQAA